MGPIQIERCGFGGFVHSWGPDVRTGLGTETQGSWCALPGRTTNASTHQAKQRQDITVFSQSHVGVRAHVRVHVVPRVVGDIDDT